MDETVETAAPVAEYTKTQRGGKFAAFKGYFYTKHKPGVMSTLWRCQDRSCHGRIQINDLGHVVSEEKHHHLPSQQKQTAVKTQDAMLKRAADGLEKRRQIYHLLTKDLDLHVAPQLLKYNSAQRAMQRVRKRLAVPLPTPTTLAEIVLLNSYKKTHRGSDFLAFDTGADDPHRRIAFATEENLNLLHDSAVWLSDGTFSISPTLFFQLYTIHGIVHDAVIPLIYALLPDKKQSTYKRLFKEIRACIIGLKPEYAKYCGPSSMITDFEQAAIKAFKKTFETTTMQGCMFHFGQCVYRKIKELGLAATYSDDAGFNQECKQLLALAFVPECDVLAAWDEMLAVPDRRLKVDSSLLQYFERTYIGSISRAGGGKSPLLPSESWNCNARVQNGDSRTTNNLEAWHRAFQQFVDCAHPSVYTFFEKLGDEQGIQEMKVTKLNLGDTPQKRKLKFTATNDRLLVLHGRYNSMSKLDYLRNVSGNLEMNL